MHTPEMITAEEASKTVSNYSGRIDTYRNLYREWRQACINACGGDKEKAIEHFQVVIGEKESLQNKED